MALAARSPRRWKLLPVLLLLVPSAQAVELSDVGVNCLPWCQETVSKFCRSMFYSFYNIACYLFFPLLWQGDGMWQEVLRGRLV